MISTPGCNESNSGHRCTHHFGGIHVASLERSGHFHIEDLHIQAMWYTDYKGHHEWTNGRRGANFEAFIPADEAMQWVNVRNRILDEQRSFMRETLRSLCDDL